MPRREGFVSTSTSRARGGGGLARKNAGRLLLTEMDFPVEHLKHCDIHLGYCFITIILGQH